MISDIWVIISYIAIGNLSGAYSLMAMIGSSLSVQILFTYAQNRKKSKRVILRGERAKRREAKRSALRKTRILVMNLAKWLQT